MALSETRRGFSFQNISDTDMWLNITGTASAGIGSKLLLANGGYYETPPGLPPLGAVSVFCAVTGKTFTGEEW